MDFIKATRKAESYNKARRHVGLNYSAVEEKPGRWRVAQYFNGKLAGIVL